MRSELRGNQVQFLLLIPQFCEAGEATPRYPPAFMIAARTTDQFKQQSWMEMQFGAAGTSTKRWTMFIRSSAPILVEGPRCDDG